MRIAFVSYEFGEYCVRQANAMADRAEVLLVVPRDLIEVSSVPVDPRVQCITFDRPRLRQAVRQLVSAQSLVRQIIRFEPDVVHYCHGHLWFNLALPLLKRFPLVVAVHDAQLHPGDGDSRTTPRRVMNFGYRRADRIIVHSRHVRDALINNLRIPAERIDLVPHVAIGELDLPSSEPQQPPAALFFGRIWKYKGLETLIDAQPRINERVPDARIVIAGQGEDFEPYRQRMADPTRFDVYNEWISGEQRDRLFQQTSVVVLPYIEASQSGVVPVASSFSRASIVTNVGGLPETVEHGRTGLIVQPEDARSLADAVASLLEDPARCREMGRAAREKLIAECSPAVVARANFKTYERTIGQRQGVRAVVRKQAAAQP